MQPTRVNIQTDRVNHVSIPQAVSTVATEAIWYGVPNGHCCAVSIPQAVSTVATYDIREAAATAVAEFQYRKR